MRGEMKMLVMLILTIFFKSAVSEDVIIQRHFKGDIFTRVCSKAGCPERTVRAVSGPGLVCTCQCQPDTPTYREDIGTCVDTIAECPVASFVTGKLSESIPFVFLPLPGQLVYPSAHVSIPQSVAVAEGPSICVVSRVDMMTSQGWRNINNLTSLSLEFQQPFQLYREAEKTYLQWMGKEVLHQSLEGRLALVNLLCKEGTGVRRNIFSPCVSFRIAGSPGKSVLVEEYSESLTQRDYITIGLCAGFLVLLYMFGMIVLIVVKKKQRRDARLREQFLNMPLPTGLGYKSSRILGLENKIEKAKIGGLNDDVRYSIKTKSFNKIEPKISREIKNIPGQEKIEEKIYDITKNGQSGSESENSDQSSGSVMELNEKLLEAHKKVVQLKLSKEVAKTLHGGGEKKLSPDSQREADRQLAEGSGGKKQQTIGGKRSSSKFSPKLDEIKEENKRVERMTRDIQPSLDSGIVTRSGSSHSNDNQEDSDSDTDLTDTEDPAATTDTDEEFLSKNDLKMFGKNSTKKVPALDVSVESDILSDIYSTAFSKVPKVLPSDTDSIYSLSSTIDKDFDYDSLDQKMTNNVRHIYRNPNIVKKSSNLPVKTKIEKEDSYEEILMNKDVPKAKHVPGLYINNDYNTNTNDNSEIEDNDYEDKTGPDDKDDQLIYSSEEKMMISITGNSESVFSNKLRIEVNAKNDKLDHSNSSGGQSGGGVSGGKSSNSQQKVWTNFAGSNLTNFADPSSSKVSVVNDKGAGSGVRPGPGTGPPSLPPKTRGTPRLPPKPLESNLNTTTRQKSKRPLPPLPAPRVPPPPPPMPK